MVLEVKPITTGASVEDWLERTKGWSIYPSVLGNQLPTLTEGKTSSEEEPTFSKTDFENALRKVSRG